MFEELAFSLREFAELPESKILLWRGLRLPCLVTDDAGETLHTDTYEMMLSWYGLSVHREMEKIQSFPYLINEIIQCEFYNNNTLKQPIDNYLKRFMPFNQHPVIVDRIKILVWVWQNKFNNFLTVFTERYAISARAEDIVELVDSEFIQDLRQRIIFGEITINEGETEFSTWILKDEEYEHNNIVMLSRVGGVSINQGYQTIVMRGAVFDLNNRILPNPIFDSYSEGIVDHADSLGESRGSGKALLSNGAALQNSEWFHRKGRLFASVVHGISHEQDCGSNVLVPFKVTSYDLLLALQGKYIKLNPEDEVLTLATPEYLKSLTLPITLWARDSAFCLSHDPAQPCPTCYGAMVTGIPYNVITKRYANVGGWSATAIIKDIGQGLLSIKHFLRNTVAVPFVVNPRDVKVISSNKHEIFLKKELVDPGTELILDAKLIKELSDMRGLDSLENVSDDKLSYFTEVTLRYLIDDPMNDGKAVVQQPVNVSVSNRKAIMTSDMLDYVLRVGWEQRDKKFISVSLSEWNFLLPMFKLTNTHEDLDYLRKEVENFMKFSNRNSKWLSQPVTPELFGETVTELWKLINTKFKGHNIIHTSTLLYSLLSTDPENGCYSIMNGHGTKYFSSYERNLFNRGAGTAFLFNDPQKLLNTPEWFLVKDRMNGPSEAYWQHAVS